MSESFTSVDVQRTFTAVRRTALMRPVTLTHRGAPDLVLLSHERFAELERLAAVARRLPTASRAVDLSEDELDAMIEARVPEAYADLPGELVGPGGDEVP